MKQKFETSFELQRFRIYIHHQSVLLLIQKNTSAMEVIRISVVFGLPMESLNEKLIKLFH
jgi:hypothetical protein